MLEEKTMEAFQMMQNRKISTILMGGFLEHRSRERIPRMFSRMAALLAVSVGISVLWGWAFDLGALKSIHPRWVTMKPNTALSFVLCGASLWLMGSSPRRAISPGAHLWFARACAMLVALIGLLTLSEYLFGWTLGIDDLLFRKHLLSEATFSPGRMSPVAAFNFALLGPAFLLANSRSRGVRLVAYGLALLVFFDSFVAILGYAYSVESLYRVGPYTSIALHTATLFGLLSAGFLSTGLEFPLTILAVDDGPAGMLTRRLLPAALLVPPVLGILGLTAERAGLYGYEFGLAMLATSNVVVFTALVWLTARSVERSDATLRQSEERFRLLVEGAPNALLMIDTAGLIVLANPRAEKLFGHSIEEMIGQPVEMLLPTRFREQHPARRAAFLRAPSARTMGAGRDLFGMRKDGVEMHIEVGLNPLRIGEQTFVLASIIDITERKRLEGQTQEHMAQLALQAEELKRSNEALERSNIELQQFAYIASHDLQSPLRSISGFVQLLKAKYGEALDDEAKDWIGRTVQATEQMQMLIRDVLAYSRVESEMRAFLPTSMRDVFNDAVALLKASVREAGGQVTCEELPTVMGDRLQLVQLLHNLIGNGLKYHGPKPPHVCVSARRSGGEWVFAIRDNGIGIAAKYHERIFEIFRRLHSQQEYPGTGIGLAVCRRIVHRHGGRIWVESDIGQGSTFYFTIPERTIEQACTRH